MKKILGAGVGIVVVVACGWTCASWYTGKRIEQSAMAAVVQANAYLASRFPAFKPTLRAESYHRGFFSSQARYVLESGFEDASVVLDTHVEHGPFPSTMVDRGQFSPVMAYVTTSVVQTDSLEPLFQSTGGQSPFVSGARISYQGDAALEWSIPALTYKSEGQSLSFSGMKGDGDFMHEERKFIGNLRVERIRLAAGVAGDQATLTIDGLSAGLNTRRGTFDLGAGQSHMHAEHVEVKAPGEKLDAAMDNAGYRVVINEEGSYVNLELVIGTETLKVSGANLGALRMVARARQLDGQALATIMREYDAMTTGLVRDNDDANARQYERSSAAVLDAAKKLLAGNPVLAIEPLLWKGDKDEQRAALSVQLAALPEKGTTRERALGAIRQVDGFFSLSRPMAIDMATRVMVEHYKLTPAAAREVVTAQIDQGIEALQDLGLARRDGDKVIGRLMYADQVVDLNGEKMPLDDFFDKFAESEQADDLELPSSPDDEDASAAVDQAADAARTAAEAAADAVASAAEDDEADAAVEGSDRGVSAPATLAGIDVQTVGGVLDMLGHRYSVGRDAVDDPLITVAPGDTGARDIRVEFYECGPTACENVQLVTNFPAGKATVAAVNAFNRENRWSRVYLDEDNEPTIEMDIDGVGGITQGALASQITAYFSMVDTFRSALGVNP